MLFSSKNTLERLEDAVEHKLADVPLLQGETDLGEDPQGLLVVTFLYGLPVRLPLEPADKRVFLALQINY